MDSWDRLRQQIATIPRLTDAEKADLARAGDYSGLVRAHLYLVAALAEQATPRRNGTYSPDDLAAYAVGELHSLARRWRPELGLAFTTYATPRLRGAMLDFHRRQRYQPAIPLDDSIPAPATQRLDLDRLDPTEREVLEARVLAQRPVAVVTVAKRLGLPRSEIRRLALRGIRKLLR